METGYVGDMSRKHLRTHAVGFCLLWSQPSLSSHCGSGDLTGPKAHLTDTPMVGVTRLAAL